jgi:DNA-binding HxlR family transcriptional regulator
MLADRDVEHPSILEQVFETVNPLPEPVEELLGAAEVGARELRRRCDDVLYSRLTELKDAGLAGQDAEGQYLLTAIGARRRKAIQPLDKWSQEWAGGGFG